MASDDTGRRASVGPYQLDEMLGGGGMGVVYRARAPEGGSVAVKILRAHLTREQDIARFRREAAIEIDHPNVIQVLDSGVDRDGTPYIVFELLLGESLEERMDRGPLSPKHAVSIAAQACDALTAAHAQGIVHRDLKPANLFCCEDGTIKLLDFGIARVGSQQLTAAGTVVGTLSYLSPEQARGGPDVDARSDLWAVGALLFEALTGRAPFDRPSPVGTLLAIMNEPAPPVGHDGSPGSKGVAELIERCLRREPDARWQTASDLGAALRGIGSLTEVPREPPTEIRPLEPDSFADTLASEPVETSIRPGEQRIVAVLLAQRVTQMAAIEAAVTEQGGRFFPLLGKAAIGLFGAQRWEGDETHRAVRAALECRMAAGTVAVGSGRVRSSGVGIAGDALRQAELASEASLLGVAVDAGTARAIHSGFSVRDAGNGLTEVIGEAPASDRPVMGGHSLLGRTVEMSQLRAMSSIAFGEKCATFVSLVGPTGIGKTRLRRELAHDMAGLEPRPLVLVGQPESAQQGVAFSLWASVIRRRAREGAMAHGWPSMEASARPLERSMALHALAREAVSEEEAARCATFLAQVVGIEVSPTPELMAARSDPQLMQDRIRRALLDWLDGLARARPLAILLEDHPWADDASLDLLAQVLAESRARPLFVLCTGRDDAALPEALDRLAVLRLRLFGLDAHSIGELAARTAGRSISRPLFESLAKRTEGNPLFVEHLVLDLRDGGLLDGEPAELPLPVSIEASVQSRLDRLSQPERELLKLLSVFGRPATAAELGALGAPESTARLEALAARDLLVVRQQGAGRESRGYGFRSPLTAEVTYAIMVPEVRRDLHGRLGRALLADPSADPEQAAGHLERGGVPDEAALQYLEATREASQRGDSASVLRCSESALDLGVNDPDARFELHMARADAFRFRGDRGEQKGELERAMALAGTSEQLIRVLTERAVWLLRKGELEEAEACAQSALQHADAHKNPAAHALALGRLGEIRMRRGEDAAATADLKRAANLAPADPPRLRAMIAGWRGQLASSQGHLGESRARFEEAAGLARAAGDERRAAAYVANLADWLNRCGEYEEAVPALEDALSALRRVGNRLVEGYVLLNLAYARAGTASPSEALGLIDEALTLSREVGDSYLGTVALVYRARNLSTLARLSAAASAAEEAISEAEKCGSDAWRALALTARARVALQAGEAEAALSLSAEAAALREELGGIEEDEALIFLVRAEALEAHGSDDEAKAVRSKGRARLHLLASRIADPLWRERFLRGPAPHRELLDTTG